ncbi:hypothetical protein LQW54_000918 [Pestalotiopsis sp. IQ-011]
MELNAEFNVQNQRTATLEAELRGLTAALTTRPELQKNPVSPNPAKFTDTGDATDSDFWLLEVDGKMAVDGNDSQPR